MKKASLMFLVVAFVFSLFASSINAKAAVVRFSAPARPLVRHIAPQTVDDTDVQFPQPEQISLAMALLPQPVNLRPPIVYGEKVSGYRLNIPTEVAAGIPLKRELETCIQYESGQRDCKFKSWAVPTADGHVLLSVSIKQLPTVPFKLLIGGIEGPINGDDFSAVATTFTGRFPGPRKIMRFLLAGLRLGGNAFAMTMMTGNPIAGISLAIGVPTGRAVLRHFMNEK